MATTNCRECGSEICFKAATCPQCGAPLEARSPGVGRLFMYGVAGAFLLTLAFGLLTRFGGKSANTASLPTAAPESVPTIDKSPVAQSKRYQFIATLRAEGLLGKVECRSQVANMWVTPRFLDLSFDNKRTLAEIVHAYCFDRSDTLATVTLKDDRTGQEVGRYSPVDGGLKTR